MANVFISHSAANEPLVQKLSSALASRGFSVRADTEIAPGVDWKDAIEDGLRKADAVIFLLVPSQETSPWLQYEWRMALKYAWPEQPRPPKPLIPLLIGPAEVPSFLRDRVALRLVDQAEQWDSFASRLVSLLNSPTGARDESGYEAARQRQQKGLRQLEEWAKALQAREEAAAPRNGERGPK